MDTKIESALPAEEEVNLKKTDLANRGLTYQGDVERRNAEAVQEGEDLMAQKANEVTTTKSKLQILREKFSEFFFKKK